MSELTTTYLLTSESVSEGHLIRLPTKSLTPFSTTSSSTTLSHASLAKHSSAPAIA